jgi:hypothetical protein
MMFRSLSYLPAGRPACFSVGTSLDMTAVGLRRPKRLHGGAPYEPSGGRAGELANLMIQ